MYSNMRTSQRKQEKHENLRRYGGADTAPPKVFSLTGNLHQSHLSLKRGKLELWNSDNTLISVTLALRELLILSNIMCFYISSKMKIPFS